MVVNIVKVDGQDRRLYTDGTLYRMLTKKVKPRVEWKDYDWVSIIDGEERLGKSTFAQQLGKVLDPELSLQNIVFDADSFVERIKACKKGSCIIFDEAFRGFSSRSSLSEVNKVLVTHMMEMGAKNLFVIIVLPSVFALDRYVLLHRARCLFHIKGRQGKRGFWYLYTKNDIKLLYLKGRQTMNYYAARPRLFGRFLGGYMVNEMAYRKKKSDALANKKPSGPTGKREASYKTQRDAFVLYLTGKAGLKQREVADILNQAGVRMTQSGVRRIIERIEDSSPTG